MKKLILVILVAVMVLSLSFAKVKITYFGDNQAQSVDAILTQIFNQSQDDIEVEFLLQSWSTDDKHTALVTRLGAKDKNPTVYLGDVIWPAEFGAAGWALDLSPYMTKDELAKFIPGTIKSCTYNGKLYAIPAFTDGGLLYYRKDLLDKYGYKPPTTWDELIKIAQDVSKKENIYGFVFQANQYEGLVCDMVEYIAANNGEIINDKNEVKINTPEVIEAMQFMQDMIHKYKIAPESVTTFGEEDARQVFQQGKAVFMRNWPYCNSITNLGSSESAVKGKYGMVPMPKGPKGKAGAATLGGWNVFVNPFAPKDEKEAGVKFAKFLTSEVAQVLRVIVAGNSPTRIDVYTNAAALKANGDLTTYYPIMINAVPRPVTPYYAEITQILQKGFHSVVTNKSKPADAAKQMEAEIKKVYQ
ncbi:MAG TPA: ABC transporter substrate-binding protein [Petrotogaceae bacterium]|nr:ABC transporter substrate-binding protein [Petrotogaceae bacterium]HQH33013.1 ABC transporter substrate-binding protein [Petrotogaceae bacterium]HQI77996.1 ABC transporter substrate-binding protein [Petrotogaceae bacterium]